MIEQEKAKKLLPIIQAIADGKQIQYKCGNTWYDVPVTDDDAFSEVCKDIIFDIYEYRIKPEEKYTIKAEKHQTISAMNTGNNNCTTTLYKEYKEKHYRPFEDTAELMVHYSKHFNIDFPPFYEPIIWVKRKDNDSRFLITGYDELDVFLEDCWQDLNELYEQYVFLDGSCIGKEE